MEKLPLLLPPKTPLLTRLIQQQAQRLRRRWRKVVTGNEEKKVREFVRESREKPAFIKLIDKIAFTVGVLNLSMCQYFLMSAPRLFWVFYTVIMPVLLAARVYHFKSLQMQYFLLDFCYFTVCLTFMNLFLLWSPMFFKVCFIFANGVLPGAIVIWGNSFVFHDLDKITSVYIHILPSMLYYTMRWGGGENLTSSSTCQATTADKFQFIFCSAPLSIWDYVAAMTLYLVWQVAYVIKTEVLDKNKLDNSPSLLTSLRWMSRDNKNRFARTILGFLRKLGIFHEQEHFDSTQMKTKLVFCLSQFIFTLVFFLPTPFLYYSHTLHFFWICFIFIVSIFNGASYYIEIFSQRYHLLLSRKEEMQRLAKAAAQAAVDVASSEPMEGVSLEQNGDDDAGAASASLHAPAQEVAPSSSGFERSIIVATADGGSGSGGLKFELPASLSSHSLPLSGASTPNMQRASPSVSSSRIVDAASDFVSDVVDALESLEEECYDSDQDYDLLLNIDE